MSVHSLPEAGAVANALLRTPCTPPDARLKVTTQNVLRLTKPRRRETCMMRNMGTSDCLTPPAAAAAQLRGSGARPVPITSSQPSNRVMRRLGAPFKGFTTCRFNPNRSQSRIHRTKVFHGTRAFLTFLKPAARSTIKHQSQSTTTSEQLPPRTPRRICTVLETLIRELHHSLNCETSGFPQLPGDFPKRTQKTRSISTDDFTSTDNWRACARP